MRYCKRQKGSGELNPGTSNLCRAVQRQLKDPQSAGASDSAPAGPSSQPEGSKERVLRTFGQKRAKADPASEQAAMLAPDVLALIAGKK